MFLFSSCLLDRVYLSPIFLKTTSTGIFKIESNNQVMFDSIVKVLEGKKMRNGSKDKVKKDYYLT